MRATPDDSSTDPVLVVSAHAADFVWRAGGFVALASETGRTVRVVCLSFGERGESQGLWKEDGMTLERVKAVRQEEALKAAATLGADIAFLDAGDYPLGVSDGLLSQLVDHMREVRPSVILTHCAADPYNDDHVAAAELTMKARMVAQAAGHRTDHPPIGAPVVFRFEPHQPEMCGFKPDVFLDVTRAFSRKLEAMQGMKAQEHLVRYYTELGYRRGVQAVRNGGSKLIEYAEAYQRVFPQVSADLR